ncbi:MAG: ABC transporter permease [Pseudomonadota bacterium]
MILLRLAWRDLFFERIQLICNVAVLVGIVLPLLVLFGVKNGVYSILVDGLLNDPNALRIETTANRSFTQADVDLVQSWPEVAFVTGKTRSIFDFVNVVKIGERTRKQAVLVPSGQGDPTLDAGLSLSADTVAVTQKLADQLSLKAGDEIGLFTQADDRPKQLFLNMKVAAVIPIERAAGTSVFATINTLNLVEAFYDEYALPEYGITEGRPLDERVNEFEGIRLFVKDLFQLQEIENRIENALNTQANSKSGDVAGILGLSRNLNIALAFTAAVAGLGLAASFVFGFWGEVERKKTVLASIALLGIEPKQLWIFPMLQALISSILGLFLSFALLWVAALAAQLLFGSNFGGDQWLVQVTWLQAGWLVLTILVFVGLSTYFAARRATKIDPALVLREGVV